MLNKRSIQYSQYLPAHLDQIVVAVIAAAVTDAIVIFFIFKHNLTPIKIKHKLTEHTIIGKRSDKEVKST